MLHLAVQAKINQRVFARLGRALIRIVPAILLQLRDSGGTIVCVYVVVWRNID